MGCGGCGSGGRAYTGVSGVLPVGDVSLDAEAAAAAGAHNFTALRHIGLADPLMLRMILPLWGRGGEGS